MKDKIVEIDLAKVLAGFDLKPECGFGATVIKWEHHKAVFAQVTEAKKPIQSIIITAEEKIITK